MRIKKIEKLLWKWRENKWYVNTNFLQRNDVRKLYYVVQNFKATNNEKC